MSKIIDGHIHCDNCDFTEALHKLILVVDANAVCLSGNGRIVVRKCPKCNSELHYPMFDIPSIGNEPANPTVK